MQPRLDCLVTSLPGGGAFFYPLLAAADVLPGGHLELDPPTAGGRPGPGGAARRARSPGSCLLMVMLRCRSGSRPSNREYRAGMAIARFPSIVIDCPDPGALVTFYGTMLDWKVEARADWAEVRADYGQCITFQQVEGYAPPRWPGCEVPGTGRAS